MQDQISRLTQVFQDLGNQEMAEIGVLPFLFLLAVSAAASILVSFLYTVFYSGRSTGSQIHRSFPLLGISITAIFISIQFSLPLSLGLLGALSIVRFRTPVKEPEEIGFIMVVIATSLACATFNLAFLVMILAVVTATLFLQSAATPIFGGRADSGVLVVSIPLSKGLQSEAVVGAVVSVAKSGRLESLAQSEGRSVITVRFRGLKSEAVGALESRLNEISDDIDTTLVFSSSTPV